MKSISLLFSNSAKKFAHTLYLLLLSALCLILTSCNGGGGGGGSAAGGGSLPGGGGGGGINIGGSGSDGPISYGDISVFDQYGALCGTGSTSADATYSLTLGNDCQAPFKIVLSGGYDLVTGLSNDTTMLSLSLNSGHINTSPLTTIIYHAALARAGGNFSNVDSADLDLVTEWATQKFNFGIDAAAQDNTGFNPFSTPLDSSNSTAFVKANEGLIETTRRVALAWTGVVTNESIGDVLAALGEDISDGILDGLNVDNTQTPEMARLSSLWEITTATVSLEMMLNEMSVTLTDNQIDPRTGISELDSATVNNGLATAISSISSTTKAAAASSLGTILPTRQFIEQTRSAATAGQQLAIQTGKNSSSFASLITKLNSMQLNLDQSGSTTTPIVGLDTTLLTNLSGNSNTITPLLDSNFNGYQTALEEAVNTTKESAPIARNTRDIIIEWAHPGTYVDGFILYVSVNSQLTEEWYVSAASSHTVRNQYRYQSELHNVGPGDLISVNMKAYSSSYGPSSTTPTYSNTVPLARFDTLDKIAGQCPLRIVFDADSAINRFNQWDFGDGEYAEQDSPLHEFTVANTYNVALTATDSANIFEISNAASLNVTCW